MFQHSHIVHPNFRKLESRKSSFETCLETSSHRGTTVFVHFPSTVRLPYLLSSRLSLPWPSYSKHCMVGHKLRGTEEGREEGEGGMVVGRGVVESGVGLRALSGQCGRVVGMVLGVGVEVVEDLDESGG